MPVVQEELFKCQLLLLLQSLFSTSDFACLCHSASGIYVFLKLFVLK